MEAGRSLCSRGTHVILSVPIKDRIVGGPFVILNTASHLAGWITHSDREATKLNSGRESFCPSAHTGGSKDVWGARWEHPGSWSVPEGAVLIEPAKLSPELYQR